MTVKVMWKVPAYGLTFQLPQQTIIIRISSQSVITKCSIFQISDLIVTVKFTPFLRPPPENSMNIIPFSPNIFNILSRFDLDFICLFKLNRFFIFQFL